MPPALRRIGADPKERGAPGGRLPQFCLSLMTLLPDLSTLLLPFRGAVLDAASALRVGIVLDRSQPSPWEEALISFLKGIPGIEVRVLPSAGGSHPRGERPSWLTDRLYSASRTRFDPFGDVSADEAEPAGDGWTAGIRSAGCGVLLWLSHRQDPKLDVRAVARHGAFTVRFGKREGMFPFWDEVARGDATSTVTVYWHESSLARGRAVRTAETSTSQGLYFTLNAEEPVIATIRTLAGMCLKIGEEGPRYLETLRGVVEEPMESLAPASYPSGVAAGRFAVEKLARSAYLRWTTRGKAARWFVALRPNAGGAIGAPGGPDLKGFQEVPLPAGTEAIADPFLWDFEGRTFLLFEEVAAGSARGRLGCVEVFDDGATSEMKIVLDRPYHLSYPCVVPANGDLFLLPETAQAARVDLYRFTHFPWEVEPVAALAEGVALVDTTPIHLNGRWYFFTTTTQPFMETHLFTAEKLDGAWTLHPASPVSCSVRNSRSAGHLFWKDGRLFRPTQDCAIRYGYGIRLNEVTRLTPDEFEERPVGYVAPAWMPKLLGTHTWNESSKFQTLDGIRFQ